MAAIGKTIADIMGTVGKATEVVKGAANQAAAQATTTGGGEMVTPASSAPSGFQGSATGVQVSTGQQQTWKNEMNENSRAWHDASPEEKARLEQANKDLAAKLGGSVAFDAGTGTWSGDAAVRQQASASAVNDYSSYIEDMNRAKREAALAALRAAYDKNVLGLNRAKDAIAPEYQSARNQAAGQAELQKKNFAEYASAQGLNSGAGGQAQLSFANALQSNLSNISAKEASTLADLELQRSQMETDYNNAIAQAEAQGNYELASQLYQEKVRQDETMRQQMQWQAQYDLQRDQFGFQQEQAGIANDQWSQAFGREGDEWSRQWAWKMAQDQAATGDYSGYRALGWSEEQIQNAAALWEAERQRTAMASATVGGGGSGSGSKMTYNKTSYDSALAAAMDGDTSDVVRRIIEGYTGLPFDTVLRTNGYASNYGTVKQGLDALMNTLRSQRVSQNDALRRIADYLESADLSWNERESLVQYAAQMSGLE